MRWRASEAAEAVGGALRGPDVPFDGAVIDSRQVQGGELFVPVPVPVAAQDGHDYVQAALGAGAAAYLTARPPEGGCAIVVADTIRALTDLGAAARRRLPDRVVGITGSAGKTSTKDLLAAALAGRFRTAASPRSYNNGIGVPLALLGAADRTEAVVVEMGARGAGHVAELCRLARPTVGIVTNVSAAHTELFGTVDDVARAKGELVEALPAHGTAVLNAGDPRVAAMADRTDAKVLRFGEGGDIRAEHVQLDEELRPSFVLRSPWGDGKARLSVRGEHQVANALAAAGAALVCGAQLAVVLDGLAHAAASPWRMQLEHSASGALVLNDAYNANPASTAAALRALARLPARRRVAVLGPMAELGERSDADHRAVAALAGELGVDIVAVGTAAYGVDAVPDGDAARAWLGALAEGDAVLVKGSRVAGLEKLAEALVHEAGA